MIQTVEAVVDTNGRVQLLGDIAGPRRALVTVLEEPGETALLSQEALAVDWSLPEEEVAWSHLQKEKLS